MPVISDNLYRQLQDLRAMPQDGVTARDRERIAQYTSEARERANLTSAAYNGVARFIESRGTKYSANLDRFYGRGTAAPAPTATPANDPARVAAGVARATRNAASPNTAGTGNS